MSLNKLPLLKLEQFVLLVYYGIKYSYLVDCCCLDVAQATEVLKHMDSKYALKAGVVVIIALENDILIANRDSITLKLAHEIRHSLPPVVVEIGRGAPSILENATEQLLFTHAIFNCLSNGDHHHPMDVLSVPLTQDLNNTVGLPFIAGWLLGYPCLYRAVHQSSEVDTEMSGDSSMINLLKLSIHATIAVHNVPAVVTRKNAKKSGTNLASSTPPPASQIELLGFSIPENLWNSRVDVRETLQSSMNEILALMNSKASNAKEHLTVTDFSIQQNIYTVPKIAL